MIVITDCLSVSRAGWFLALVASVASVPFVPWLAGCSNDPSDQSDASTADSDTDSDTDTETDSSSDSDSDADGGQDAGGDGGVPMTPGDYDDPAPIEWVALDGGSFSQGSEDASFPAEYCETPLHDVTISSFEMLKTEVTTSQYAQCVLDGTCAEPAVASGDGSTAACNWLWWGRDDHPVNCVTALDAEAYCSWLGARLPSESEWEYAARSCGQSDEYPWGDEEANCDFAVMLTPSDGEGCGLERSWPVCSLPAGNTAQGLCDMSGNTKEWVADCWHGSYDGAPTDGSAWVSGECEDNVLRGGGFKNLANAVRARTRSYNPSTGYGDFMGFRCARSAEFGERDDRLSARNKRGGGSRKPPPLGVRPSPTLSRRERAG
jgi:formylglycine-generating enzyme